METNYSIMEDINQNENCDYLSYKPEEIIEILDSPSPVNIETNNPEENLSNDELKYASYAVQDEPIDLTSDKSGKYNMQAFPVPNNTMRRIIIQPKQSQYSVLKNAQCSPSTGRDLKRPATDNFNCNQNVPSANWNQMITTTLSQNLPASNNTIHSMAGRSDITLQLANRQQEVLNTAKSIFSKRTRTLYHWMYPTASKQQIKQVVSNTWDSMPPQEKNIYIAQVLGKFTPTNANLMINPQLGQIKELPPLLANQNIAKTSELQNAISSISYDTENIDPFFCNKEQPKKKPRMTKKKLAESLSSSCQEFDDDPELSQELAQFSSIFKNQF